MPKTDAAQCRPPRRRRANGRFRRLGHAGQLRLADRRASRGAHATPGCSTCRTCASSISPERRRVRATFLRYALANNVDKLKVPGKALYSCLLARDGGVLDDLIVYYPARGFLPSRRQRGHRRQGHRVARQACVDAMRPELAITPRDRSRDDCRAGTERPRESLAAHCPAPKPRRARKSRSAASKCNAEWDRSLSRAPDIRVRTASRSSCRASAQLRCGTHCRRQAWRRAGSAHATRCGSRRG